MSDPITAAIEGAIAEATQQPEAVEVETVETESASETADVAEGSADIEDGQEQAAPEAKAEGQQAVAEPPKKKKGPIPYDRHEAVLTKARNEAKAQQAELNKRIEALSKYESAEYQAQFKFLELLEREPARAVAILRQVDPQRYAHLTWAEQVAQAKEDAKAATTAPEKPQPDALLPDGTLGYSAEGAEKLLQWQLAQERQAYQAEIAKLRDEFKPVRTEHEARVALAQSYDKMGKKLENARTNWPAFKDHEVQIREELSKPGNERMTLEEGYHRVVVAPKFDPEAKAKEEAALRAKWVAELNSKSKARGVTPGQVPAASATEDSKPRDTEDIIRESIRSLQA